MGNRKRPFYRVVAAEESHRRDGRFIEIVGTYDPLRKPAAIEVKSDAVLKWLANGAQPTDTVKRILAKSGVWAHWRAVQSGEAELSGMTDRVSGTVERERAEKPSKKTVARIAEEEKTKAEEAQKAKEEAEKAEEPAEEPAEEKEG
jgi:small subunit ribosomal protein S16